MHEGHTLEISLCLLFDSQKTLSPSLYVFSVLLLRSPSHVTKRQILSSQRLIFDYEKHDPFRPDLKQERPFQGHPVTLWVCALATTLYVAAQLLSSSNFTPMGMCFPLSHQATAHGPAPHHWTPQHRNWLIQPQVGKPLCLLMSMTSGNCDKN